MTPPYPVPPPTPWPRKTPSWTWAAPVFTCGLLGFLPPVLVAAKVKTRQAWAWAAGFGAAEITALSLDHLDPKLFGSLLLATGVGSAIYSTVAARQVPWGPQPVYPMVLDPNSQAVAGVLAARQRRVDALALAGSDPELARELRIGRPDLPRLYDDGGLVDVNSTSAPTIATWLGLSDDQAVRIIDARIQLGRFERPEDLVNLGGLEVEAFEHVRDRIVVL